MNALLLRLPARFEAPLARFLFFWPMKLIARKALPLAPSSLAQALQRVISSIKLRVLSTLNDRQAILDAPLRPVRFFAPDVALTRRPDGSLLMRSAEPLAGYDQRIGDWLDLWARYAPGRDFLVEQTPEGERTIRYGEARAAAVLIAQNLLAYGLTPDRPLAILAPNSIDHALVMLAALYVGIPIAPIAPAYALQTADFSKLAHSFRLLTPGMVMVEDGARYADAIGATLSESI